jgi:predicted AAA+ superfamily ATPase
VAIVGPRQCGKSTSLKQFQNDHNHWKYFDLEKHADYEYITRDPDLFLNKNPNHIIIDEAQTSPEIFSALRVAIDSDRLNSGRFLLSGSSSPELLSSISESLAGRIAIIEMSPLSFSETQGVKNPFLIKLFLNDFDINNIETQLSVNYHVSLDKFWFHGGYPEAWIKDDDLFFEVWKEQYFKTYIERDIKNLFPNINSHRFRKLIDVLSGISGDIINYSNIARMLEVSQPVAKDYLRIVHGTFIWRTIPAFSKNIKKRIIKHPKGYLRDTGLLHHLLQISSPKKLLTHPRFGSSFEILVIEEILRSLNNHGIIYKEYHYRTSTGAEIDLIIEGKFGLIPIEIKYNSTVKKNQLITIKSFIKEFNCSFGIVVNNAERIIYYDDNLIGIPFSLLTAEL